MRKAGKSCKNQSPPYCPGTGSDHCATSHPHAQNPAYQSPPDDKHPGTACNSPSPRAQSAVLSDVAHSGICECHPGRPATRVQCAFYLQPPVSLAQPGAAHRDDCGPVPQSPPASLPAASLPSAIRKYASGSAEIFTQGIYHSPSGVLITKPHDSAGAHRRACARIADSVCVINRDLLRKFINGKETAKISHHAAHLTPAHALAASVLTDIRGGVVELIRHCPARVTTLIRAVGPHTGIRQHNATGKQRSVRLRRCCQHKRGCHGRQL